ncbi:acyltransferase family protein [Thermomonospora umbrina]|uniref:Peptidoglycan/LPS O-acetylase OafA/YrhL n=1 Tax=Thermomonospora umbrina TaxID=111806 RepID=A0A3D9SLM4_9ACTN|nr:acyltransferase [Thermomonospora umbrina]REE94813.1 peptidoglycan/LPS O-acetylase OafA/YrhL [Thermomonospora umbrina]
MATVSPNGSRPGVRGIKEVAHPPEGAPSGGRMPELEGYRGLAAISTVVFHVWQHYTRYGPEGARPPVTNPVLGTLLSLEVVDLFFVLSAFLLTLSYARAAIDRTPYNPARVFLFRRAVRILPLYWFAITFVWATRNPELPGDWRDLLEHLTFTQVFDTERIFYTIGPAWSMSLEIMFYGALVILGPAAVRACRPIARRRTRVALCAAGCLVVYAVPVIWLAVARYALHIPHTEWSAYFGPQARFHAFGAGMFLAVLLVALGDRARVGGWSRRTLLLTVPAALLVLTWLADDTHSPFHLFYHPACALLWTILIYATVHVTRVGRWQRVLRARHLTGVGLVSYSLYIWHEPIMIALGDAGLLPTTQSGFPLAIAIILATALPAAVLSYWCIEYPTALLRRLRDSAHRPRDYYPTITH